MLYQWFSSTTGQMLLSETKKLFQNKSLILINSINIAQNLTIYNFIVYVSGQQVVIKYCHFIVLIVFMSLLPVNHLTLTVRSGRLQWCLNNKSLWRGCFKGSRGTVIYKWLHGFNVKWNGKCLKHYHAGVIYHILINACLYKSGTLFFSWWWWCSVSSAFLILDIFFGSFHV